MKMQIAQTWDWTTLCESLTNRGHAHLEGVLSPEECDDLVDFYRDESLFRSTINMQRYRFGVGEYKYFAYPLPPLVDSLRERFYAGLAPLAREWMSHLGIEADFPARLGQFLAHCHVRGQARPTPLILRYESGGYNTLHQDLYGDAYFPFQVVFMLRERGKDYEGGELVFVEQLPRAQSRAEVVTPAKGDAVVFTTNFRPVKGSRGYYRSRMKHGVSPVKGWNTLYNGIDFS